MGRNLFGNRHPRYRGYSHHFGVSCVLLYDEYSNNHGLTHWGQVTPCARRSVPALYQAMACCQTWPQTCRLLFYVFDNENEKKDQLNQNNIGLTHNSNELRKRLICDRKWKDGFIHWYPMCLYFTCFGVSYILSYFVFQVSVHWDEHRVRYGIS